MVRGVRPSRMGRRRGRRRYNELRQRRSRDERKELVGYTRAENTRTVDAHFSLEGDGHCV